MAATGTADVGKDSNRSNISAMQHKNVHFGGLNANDSILSAASFLDEESDEDENAVHKYVNNEIVVPPKKSDATQTLQSKIDFTIQVKCPIEARSGHVPMARVKIIRPNVHDVQQYECTICGNCFHRHCDLNNHLKSH